MVSFKLFKQFIKAHLAQTEFNQPEECSRQIRVKYITLFNAIVTDCVRVDFGLKLIHYLVQNFSL